jgi:hypothetical protein
MWKKVNKKYSLIYGIITVIMLGLCILGLIIVFIIQSFFHGHIQAGHLIWHIWFYTMIGLATALVITLIIELFFGRPFLD